MNNTLDCLYSYNLFDFSHTIAASLLQKKSKKKKTDKSE